MIDIEKTLLEIGMLKYIDFSLFEELVILTKHENSEYSPLIKINSKDGIQIIVKVHKQDTKNTEEVYIAEYNTEEFINVIKEYNNLLNDNIPLDNWIKKHVDNSIYKPYMILYDF